MTHVCLFAHGEEPALFCGDTLFNAGAGNCHNGGDPEVLYDTFATQIARLPDATRVYPGHEYLSRNLEFTLDREPDNSGGRSVACESEGPQCGRGARHARSGEEKDFNTFLRLQSPGVIARLRERFPEIGERPSARTVFLKLRQLRNTW